MTTPKKIPIATRLAAIAVIILGLLLVVLAPAGGSTGSWRIVGALLLVGGAIWLVKQPKPEVSASTPRAETPPMQWYQSPILWVPVIIAVLAVITFFINQ